jgi:hypothetical protein
MTFYTIYLKDQLEPENCMLVEEGFSWYNFFFGFIWSIYKRIWSLSLIHFMIFLIFFTTLQFHFLNEVTTEIIGFFLSIAIAFYANDFYRKTLEKKGYKLVDVVASKNKKDALMRFLERNCKTS